MKKIINKARLRVLYISRLENSEIHSYYGYKEQLSLAGQRKMRSVLTALEISGCKTDVLSPLPVKPAKSFLRGRFFFDEIRGVSIWVPPLIGRWVPKKLCQLFVIFSALIHALKIAKNNRYDLVIFYNYAPDAFIPACMLKIVYDIPIVIEAEEDLKYDPNLPLILRAFSMIASRIPVLDGAICVNQMVCDRIGSKYSVILPGLAGSDEQTERRLLSMPVSTLSGPDVSEPVILFSGRLDHARGIDLFLDASLEFDNLGGQASFLICGWGNDSQIRKVRMKVDKIASRLKRVKLSFFGTLTYDRYFDLLASATIVVNLLSAKDDFSAYSFPSKLTEYLAAGKVVLSTNNPGISILPNKSLVFLHNEHPKEIASTLNELLENYDSYITNAQRGREWVKRHATFDTWSESLTKLLHKVITT